MSKFKYLTILALAEALALGGCGVGMEPEGPSPDQIRAKIATLPPDEQIAMIQHSPMPKADQEQKIREIRTKYGLSETPKAPSPK